MRRNGAARLALGVRLEPLPVAMDGATAFLLSSNPPMNHGFWYCPQSIRPEGLAMTTVRIRSSMPQQLRDIELGNGPPGRTNSSICRLVVVLAGVCGMSTAQAAPPDRQAPTAPSNLTAAPTSSSQVNLSWMPATDNVGVTGYLLERCVGATCTAFAQIATSTTTTYINTGLQASTTYRYRVRARDQANNLSSYSNIAGATTSPTPDTEPPTAPSDLTAVPASPSQVNVSWMPSTDNVGVAGYVLERCTGTTCTAFAQIATPTTTAHINSGLLESTTYRYRVAARDQANNLSSYSSITDATTPQPPDTQAPTVPLNLVATAVSNTQVNLRWSASTDNRGVTGYLVERCEGVACSSFAEVSVVPSTAFNDMGLAANGTYRYRVRAKDAVPNYSAYSSAAQVTASVTEVECD